MLPSRRILSFLAIAFGSTWCIAGIGAACGIRASSGFSYTLLAASCMLMPALSAIVQQRVIERQPWSGLGLGFRTMDVRKLLLTALLGCAIIPLALAACYVLGDVFGITAFGHVSLTSERLVAALQALLAEAGAKQLPAMAAEKLLHIPATVVLVGGLVGAVIAACTVNLPFMLGEELGWRGYLYQATLQWGVLRRVLFTGVVWGLWHAPLILMGHNYPGHPVAGIGLMVVFCTLLAFLFNWSRTRVKAVWGPCVLHGIINGSAGLFTLFAWDGHVLVASPAGVAGFVALGILALLIAVLDRRSWKGDAAPQLPVLRGG
ncbi:MAG: CPBP family intramembrane glutamic endopeptidase [Flavobacteriales bacterium]